MHETQHGTVFRTHWINEVVYYICCFTSVQEPSTNRRVHTERHTHTSIRGADHEFQTGRPPQLWNIVLEEFRIPVVYDALVKMIRNAAGNPTEELRAAVGDDTQFGKMRFVSIMYLSAYVALFAWALTAQSWLPLLFTFGASFIGGPLVWTVFFTEHPGLEVNVLDHRRNSRTVYTDPVMRFLCWNINYHIEHHMYPMVPFHQLPALHARIKSEQFQATADRVSFSEMTDILTIEGTPRNDANLWFKQSPNDRNPTHLIAEKITYRISDQMTQTQGVKNLNINQ